MSRYLDFKSGSDGNGYRASVFRHAREANVFAVIPAAHMNSAWLSAQAKALALAMENSTRQLSEATDRFSERGFRDWAKPPVFQPIGRAFRDYRNAALARRSDLENIRRDWAKPRFPSDEQGPSLRSELRSWLASMSPAQSIEAATTNFDIAAAVAEGGNVMAAFLGWPDDVWSRFIEAFSLQNLAGRLAEQHMLKLTPTPNDIFREGPDLEAASRAAKDHLRAHKDSLAQIGETEATLSGVIDFTALTMDESREAAFETLMAM